MCTCDDCGGYARTTYPYLVFAGSTTPEGGAYDFVGACETYERALRMAIAETMSGRWAHIAYLDDDDMGVVQGFGPDWLKAQERMVAEREEARRERERRIQELHAEGERPA